MIWKYTLAWIPMILIAIANGTLRQFGYGPFVSELTAHQISCGTGIFLFFLYTFLLSGRWPIRKSHETWFVGTIWLILTIAFEFLFGHYAGGHSWSRLLQDYNICVGRLWSLVLAALFFMPYTVFRIRQRILPSR
jgi:hypothetical protein